MDSGSENKTTASSLVNKQGLALETPSVPPASEDNADDIELDGDRFETLLKLFNHRFESDLENAFHGRSHADQTAQPASFTISVPPWAFPIEQDKNSSLVSTNQTTATYTRRNFSTSSTNISLDEEFNLIAECEVVGELPRISMLSLTSCLSNWNGTFQWMDAGMPPGNFHLSARQVRLDQDDQSILRAELRNVDGNWVSASTCLDDRISNANGVLTLLDSSDPAAYATATPVTIPLPLGLFMLWDSYSQTAAIKAVINAQRRGDNIHMEQVISCVLDYLQIQLRAERLPGSASVLELRQMFTLVSLLGHRFSKSRDVDHLLEYVRTCEMIEKKYPELPSSNPLGVMLWIARKIPQILRKHVNKIFVEASRTGTLGMVDEAIRVIEEAKALTPDDHPQWPDLVLKTCQLHLQRYYIELDEDDLHLADSLADTFLNSGLVPDEIKGIFMTTLAECRTLLGRISGTSQHFEQIVRLYEEAIPLLDHYHPKLGSVARRNLEVCKSSQPKTANSGDTLDLVRLLKVHKDLVDNISSEKYATDPGEAIETLCNYCNVLGKMYMRTKDTSFINEALFRSNQAADVYHQYWSKVRLGAKHLSRILECLASTQSIRFQVTQAPNDLDNMISCLQYAVKLASENHVEMSGLLNFLSGCLSSRAERNFPFRSDIVTITDDLEEAISSGRRACNLSLERTGDCSFYASNLVRALCIRWDYVKKDDSDHKEAMELAEQCWKTLQARHPQRSVYALAITGILVKRFYHYHSREDYERATVFLRKAFEERSPDTFETWASFATAAKWMYDAFAILAGPLGAIPSDSVVQLVMDICQSCLASNPALSNTHIVAAMTMVRISARRGLWDEAVHHSGTIVATLANLLDSAWSRRTQEWTLGQFQGIPSVAGCVAIQWGKTCSTNEEGAILALRFIETSRGLLAKVLVTLKNDISALEDAHPTYADQYKTLRQKMIDDDFVATPTIQPEQTGIFLNFGEDKLAHRLKIKKELEDLTSAIRTLPGFGNFQVDLPFETITQFVRQYRIVQFVVSGDWVDAIVIDQKGLRSIALPHFRAADIASITQKFFYSNGKLARHRPLEVGKLNEDLKECLQWIWRVAVKPVLEELGLLGSKNDGVVLPRIWWLATGVASQLPFHAAGEGLETTSNTFDHVVSSYISSLAALMSAKQSEPLAQELSDHRMAVFSMPTTPNTSLRSCWKSLNTAQEETNIRSTASSLATTFLTNPTKAEALEAISTSSVVHFICHGDQQMLCPSESALLLGKADAHEPDRLMVKDLVRSMHSHTKLAYLAACSTGQNVSSAFADEHIHMANAFQLAGFPHVIGTMWAAKDKAACAQTGYFYKALFEGMRHTTKYEENHDTVAYALHAASAELRKDKRFSKPLAWAPFVHFGA